MPIVTIDGKEFDTDNLSTDAKNALLSLQFTDSEIQRTQAKLAALQTARNAYARSLKQLIATPQEKTPS